MTWFCPIVRRQVEVRLREMRLKPCTVKPRYSAFQGTGQNYALYQGFHYCQYINNYENASWDQNLYALLAELC